MKNKCPPPSPPICSSSEYIPKEAKKPSCPQLPVFATNNYTHTHTTSVLHFYLQTQGVSAGRHGPPELDALWQCKHKHTSTGGWSTCVCMFVCTGVHVCVCVACVLDALWQCKHKHASTGGWSTCVCMFVCTGVHVCVCVYV